MSDVPHDDIWWRAYDRAIDRGLDDEAATDEADWYVDPNNTF